MAPYILKEHLEALSEEEINEYLENIDIEEDGQYCFSDKLQILAVTLGNQRFDRLSNFLEDNPVISWDYEDFSGERIQEDISKTHCAPTALYNLIDHQETYNTIRSIVSGYNGLYAPSKEPIISSFEPRPAEGFEPSDPTSYYTNQIEYMFKAIDYNSMGVRGDFQALELCIKTWIRKSIRSFHKGDYAEALYIISAVVSEFVKGLSIELISEELSFDLDFQVNMEIYLKDALSLTLLYMEYVDDEVYCKVNQRLQQLVETHKVDEESPLEIDFTPLIEYQTLRKAKN